MKKFTSYFIAWLILTCGLFSQNTINNMGNSMINPVLLLAPLSGDYTINSNNATGGTNFNNFTDFADVINTFGLAGPVTVNVVAGSGPYTEQVLFGQFPGSSSENPLTINGNGETLRFLSTDGNQRATLKYDGTDNVIVNNLIIEALGAETGEFGWAVWLTNEADYNSFYDCQFIASITSTLTHLAAFVTSNSATTTTTAGLTASYLTIQDCVALGGNHGMVINGPTAEPFSEGNVIVGNVISDFRSFGFYIRGQSNAVFSNNEVSRPTTVHNPVIYMVYLTGQMNGTQIVNNRLFDFSPAVVNTSAAYGFYGITVAAEAGQELLIANNLLYRFEGMNGAQYGIYFLTSGNNIRVYHNTFSLDNANYSGTGIIRAIHHAGANTTIDIRNNIFSITSNSTGAKYCLWFSTNTANVTTDNNVLHMGTTLGTIFTGRWSGVDYASLSDWQAVPGKSYDLSSSDLDPVFVAPLVGDLTPTTADIDDIGANLLAFVPDDFFGAPRTATPDPGAIEFEPPACPPPSAQAVQNITPTAADLEWVENGSATLWDIELGAAGFEPTGIPTHNAVNSNPFTTVGLNPVNSYDWYVRSRCGGSELSTWTGPHNFRAGSDPLSGNYTINSTLPTLGNNFNNFSDLAYALNLAGLAGAVVVDVVSGTGPYYEQIIFQEFPNSSEVNNVTINGNGEMLQFLSSNSNNRATLRFDQTKYVTINNLIVEALGAETGQFGWAVWLSNGADFNSFLECQFIASSTSSLNHLAAFVTSNNATNATATGLAASNLTIQNSVLTGGFWGMVINGPTSAPFSQGNIIFGNEIRDFNQYGIYLRGQNNSVVSENILSRPTRATTATLYMIYATSNMTGTQIKNNRIFDISPSNPTTQTVYGIYSTGVSAESGNELLIANNLIYGFHGANGVQRGMYLLTTNNTRVYHNTISMDNAEHPGSSVIIGLHHTGANAEIDIRNNIISVTSNSTGLKHCLFFGTATAMVTTDYNVLHMGATLGTNHIGRWDGTDYTTLGNWQAVPGKTFDLNSKAVNPQFTDPLIGDLTPLNLEIDNIGTNLLSFVPTDFFGVSRTVTPDPGAIEFYPPVCEPPTDLLASDISAVSALLNWTPGGDQIAWNIEWGIEGFEPGSGNLINGITTNSYLLDGLDPGTVYEFYVQSDCGDGAKLMSEWAGPQSFITNAGQRIMTPLANQWGYVSTYIDLSSKVMLEELLAEILNEMVILIGSDGIFWPAQNINSIGEWDTFKGYKLKMANDGSLVFPGIPVSNKTVIFTAGTHIIPVLSEVPVDVMDLFEGLAIEYAFDLNGAIYWPLGGIYTLTELVPGYGYLVRFNSITTLDFDAAKQSTTPNIYSSSISNTPWNEVNKTGDVHITGIAAGALEALQKGDVIGAFNTEGLCTGVAAYQPDESVVLVVYGNDITTSSIDGMNNGELVNMKLFRNGDIIELSPIYNPTMPNADGLFAANGFSVITDLKVGATGIGLSDAQVIRIAPNPSNGMFNIYGADNSTRIAVINSKGQTVYAGIITNPCLLDLTNQPAGVYFIRMISNDQIRTEKLIID